MTLAEPVTGRATTRSWGAAALVALLFVGLQGLGGLLTLILFYVAPDEGSFIWDIVSSGWGIYLSYLGLVAGSGYLLWAARDTWTSFAWSSLVWRAAAMFLPALVVVHVVLGVGTGLIQDQPFQFLGVQILS